MAATPSVSRPRRLLALLLCLLGVASVIFSFFYLPFYVPPISIYAISAWEWTSRFIANMHALGVSPSFLFLIGWTLAPLVAAALTGALGVARFAFAKPILALLYLIVCLLGAIVLGLTFFVALFALRLGALGEVVGYALCFWADYLWRGKRPAHVDIWKESA